MLCYAMFICGTCGPDFGIILGPILVKNIASICCVSVLNVFFHFCLILEFSMLRLSSFCCHFVNAKHDLFWRMETHKVSGTMLTQGTIQKYTKHVTVQTNRILPPALGQTTSVAKRVINTSNGATP